MTISITMVPIRIPQISVGRPQIDFAAVASIGYIRAVSVTDCWYRPLELLNNRTSSGPGSTTKSSVPAEVPTVLLVVTSVGVWLGDAIATEDELTLSASNGKPMTEGTASRGGEDGTDGNDDVVAATDGNGGVPDLSNMSNAFRLAT